MTSQASRPHNALTPSVDSLRSNVHIPCSVLGNNFGVEGAKAILDAAKAIPHLTSLCGFKPDQTEADLSRQGLGDGDAMLLAFELQKRDPPPSGPA